MMDPELSVLLVDDERINLKILSELLRNEARISLANNGPDAVAKAREMLPDIILLDVVMPVMNGFDVIHALKKCSTTRAIPVIFITALGDAASEEKGFELGACDYIQKPFHAAVVRARVKLHLQMARQRLALENLANVDSLTGIANRRRYEEVLEGEWLACKREQRDLTVAMVDVDFFKCYNDCYGHVAGDEVLTDIAATLQAQMRRPHDFVARYGGEEFVIISVDNGSAAILSMLQRCVDAVRELQIPHRDSVLGLVSVSIGGVSCVPDGKSGIGGIVEEADQMLYQAKREGRNAVSWRSLHEVADVTERREPEQVSAPC